MVPEKIIIEYAELELKNHGIYIIYNTKTRKAYIGQTRNAS